MTVIVLLALPDIALGEKKIVPFPVVPHESGFAPVSESEQVSATFPLKPPMLVRLIMGWVAGWFPFPCATVTADGLALSEKSEMMKGLLVAEASDVPDAVMVKTLLLPLLMLQPAKIATPEAAIFGFALHVSVPPLGFVSIASVMEAVELVTVLPPAS